MGKSGYSEVLHFNGKRYISFIFGNSKVEVLKFQHNSSEIINLNLRSGGGFLLKVIPIEP